MRVPREHCKAGNVIDNTRMDIFFDIGSDRYVATGSLLLELDGQSSTEPTLATVVPAQEGVPMDKAWLRDYLDRLEEPEVFPRQSFLKRLIITDAEPGQTVTAGLEQYLDGLGTEWINLRVKDESDKAKKPDPGPYLMLSNVLKEVCRVYDDEHGAFLAAVKPKSNRSHKEPYVQLKAAGSMYARLGIAVPARAFVGSPSSGQPRLRIAVKDCYHLKGLKTSLCNQAFYEISTPAPHTAKVVQALTIVGAQVLGLTKLSSMVAREEPIDAVDFHTAFNPRADGYQSPAGSSSGSAVAVAAYQWLDCAIGTDTSGSGRRPAMVNGVWEFRPTHDTELLHGMITTYPRFDTPCIYARRFEALEYVAQTWTSFFYPGNSPPDLPLKSPSYRIIYPLEYLPVNNVAQMQHIDDFIDDMVAYLPATVQKLSIRDQWKQSHPRGTPDDVDEYLSDVITRTFYYEFFQSSNEFRKLYSETHGGKPPYVIPFVQRRWEKGAAVSKAEHEDATNRMLIYKSWLHDALFNGRPHETLLVLPIGKVEPHYRDELSPSPEEQSALDELFVQSILGAPDIVVPIGEVPYKSRISGQVEYLPVMINIVGAPTTDLALLQAIKKVVTCSGRPTNIATGPRMFSSTKGSPAST